MPPEFVTDSFLPSEEAQRVTGAQKTGETLLLVLKTGRQRLGQDRRGDQASFVDLLMRGRAVLLNSYGYC
jgi:hypothetical protein